MVHEKQNTLSKKEQKKRSNKKDEIAQKKKKNSHSDSEQDSNFSESDTEMEEMDVQEYRKFLSKLFPSKYLDKKISNGNKLKKILNENKDSDSEYEEDYPDETNSDEDSEPKKNRRRPINNTKEIKSSKKKNEKPEKDIKKNVKKEINKKNIKPKKKEELTTEIEEDKYHDDTEEEEEEEDKSVKQKNSEKVNIIFTIGGLSGEDEEYDEEYEEDEEWEDMSDYETENEDDTVSECSDTTCDSDEKEEEHQKVVVSKRKTDKKKNQKISNEIVSENVPISVEKVESEKEPENDEELLKQLKEIYEKNKNNKTIQKCIDVCEENIKNKQKKLDKKTKKYKDRNVRIFKKIMKDKNVMNDYNFFEKLEIDNQKKIIKELKEINKMTRVEKPYRITLLESNIPTLFKGAAMKKINSLRYMEPGSGEYYKIKNWVDNFMRMPFENYQTLPINISDGVDKCHEFMEKSKNILDSAVYGLNDAKMQIMQMLGQLVTNPQALGCAIAIQGPPGTGKTSLVKEGISKILNRPFSFIALGGATDSSFLEGHSYTYEGSTWGKIVQILLDSKCMNPVIYFDELDKISDTPKGEEIAGILTHLTDSSQNSQFHDKYFAEIDFDLSKCLFIFSYNDESKINPILKDRMYRIQTKGYNVKQKTIISKDYLLPKIREQVVFNKEDIIIPDETLNYIIEQYCNKEEGVRNLKRCLEIVYTKLNLYRLMKPGTNLFEQEMSIQVKFPFCVTKDMVDKLIKVNKDDQASYKHFYI